jgi:GrpB-like predicted nucleotidyltransferase (UPF0157 family)
MKLGLKRGTVCLQPYNIEWKKCANETIAVLKNILNFDAVDIQHIGSTAIEGILAKPIIDIAVGAKNFQDVLQHKEELKDVGIIFRGEDVARQMLFVIGDFEKDFLSYHIHVVIWNEQEWKNYLNFRDYLNATPTVAQKYSKLKEKLAELYSDNRNAYTEGKQALIDEILLQATQWRKENYANSSLFRI